MRRDSKEDLETCQHFGVGSCQRAGTRRWLFSYYLSRGQGVPGLSPVRKQLSFMLSGRRGFVASQWPPLPTDYFLRKSMFSWELRGQGAARAVFYSHYPCQVLHLGL